MRYHAIITKEGSRTLAEFLDAPGCQTFAERGESIEEFAPDALQGWLNAQLQDGRVPPRPRSRPRPPAEGTLLPVAVSAVLAARLQVRWARDEEGISQTELARRVGVSQQAIARIESPDANVSMDTLERVAAALGRRVDLNLVPA